MRNPLVLVVCLLVSLVPRPVSAQLYEAVGIRAQGMGGAFVAVADDATATWWNAAGLATGPFFDALVEYGRIRTSPETRLEGFAVAFPALGVSYYHLPFNQMRPLTSTGTTGSDRQDEGAMGVYGLTAGQSIGTHFVMASTLKLARAGETHTDLDLGALARYGVLQLGISVKNLRKPEFNTGDGVLTLDRQARAGFALVGHTSGLINAITLSMDADLTRTRTVVGGETRHVAGGIEAWVFGKKVGLRAGASANTAGDKGTSASGGISLVLLSGQYVKTYLDAQYTNGTDESRRSWGTALRATF